MLPSPGRHSHRPARGVRRGGPRAPRRVVGRHGVRAARVLPGAQTRRRLLRRAHQQGGARLRPPAGDTAAGRAPHGVAGWRRRPHHRRHLRGQLRTGAFLDPFRRAVTTPAARLAVASAAIFGFVDVSKRLLMQELAVPPQVFVPVLLTTVAATMAPFALRAWPEAGPRGDLPKWLGVGVLVASAQHLTAVSFQTLSASIASPLVNSQAVVAVVLGACCWTNRGSGRGWSRRRSSSLASRSSRCRDRPVRTRSESDAE